MIMAMNKIVINIITIATNINYLIVYNTVQCKIKTFYNQKYFFLGPVFFRLFFSITIHGLKVYFCK